MGLLGFRFAFYLSQQSLFQSIYKFLFVKRPRDSNDILIEPLDTSHWMCESYMIPMTPSSKKTLLTKFSSFSLNKTYSASSSIYHSFDLKEKYFLPPFSSQEKEKGEEGHFLLTYSVPVNIENVEKKLRVIRNTPCRPFSFSDVNLSSVSFLDIQYHHPEMKDSLILEIPKDWCCVGNDLFSSAFILRMLYYQTLPFVFDMRYTLDIMDNDLNMFSLNSHQFIVLKETSYEIV
jgi:hypothetical protein